MNFTDYVGAIDFTDNQMVYQILRKYSFAYWTSDVFRFVVMTNPSNKLMAETAPFCSIAQGAVHWSHRNE